MFDRAMTSLVTTMMVRTHLCQTLIHTRLATSMGHTLPVSLQLVLTLTTSPVLRPMRLLVLTEFLDAPEALVMMF